MSIVNHNIWFSRLILYDPDTIETRLCFISYKTLMGIG
jgi:hypothetical protein